MACSRCIPCRSQQPNGKGHGHSGIDRHHHEGGHHEGIGEMAQQDEPPRTQNDGRHDQNEA